MERQRKITIIRCENLKCSSKATSFSEPGQEKIIEVLTFTIRSREEAEKQHDGLFRTCEMKIYERKRPSCDLKLLLTQLTSEFFVKLAAGKYQTW